MRREKIAFGAVFMRFFSRVWQVGRRGIAFDERSFRLCKSCENVVGERGLDVGSERRGRFVR